MHISSVWIFIIIFPSYELYKIVRISVICCLPRSCPECAMIRPRQHGLAVLVSSTPVPSLLVFIIAIFFGLKVHMPRTCSKQWKGNHSGVSLRCFAFVSVESGEHLGLLQSLVHKLFGYLTLYRNLLKIGI